MSPLACPTRRPPAAWSYLPPALVARSGSLDSLAAAVGFAPAGWPTGESSRTILNNPASGPPAAAGGGRIRAAGGVAPSQRRLRVDDTLRRRSSSEPRNLPPKAAAGVGVSRAAAAGGGASTLGNSASRVGPVTQCSSASADTGSGSELCFLPPHTTVTVAVSSLWDCSPLQIYMDRLFGHPNVLHLSPTLLRGRARLAQYTGCCSLDSTLVCDPSNVRQADFGVGNGICNTNLGINRASAMKCMFWQGI